MTDLHDRFASFERLPAPDVWPDVLHRVAQPRPSPRWGIATIGTSMALAGGALIVMVMLSLYAFNSNVGPPDPTSTPHSPPATTAPAEANRLLVYELDGVIYLADADGSHPTRVGDGGLQQTTMTGSVWSPDGRHFVYHNDGDSHIADAQGRVVASFASRFEGPWGGPYWSPDSTRLQEWTDNGTRISIYGIDGDVQTSLALPDGYARLYETEAVWASDGRSVLVRIRQSDAGEVWQVPIDGSAPQRVADDHPFVRGRGAFSPDGRRVAYVPNSGPGELLVANADGSDARKIAEAGLSGFMAWSPDGERLADINSGGNLVVLEVATGTVSTAVRGFSSDGLPPFSWSSASDKLLFAASGDLWSVNVDGTGRTTLVEGAGWGAMPPANATGASLIRIAGHDVSVVLPAAVAGQVPADGDAGNGTAWRNDVGSRWMTWYLYAPGDIDDPRRHRRPKP